MIINAALFLRSAAAGHRATGGAAVAVHLGHQARVAGADLGDGPSRRISSGRRAELAARQGPPRDAGPQLPRPGLREPGGRLLPLVISCSLKEAMATIQGMGTIAAVASGSVQLAADCLPLSVGESRHDQLHQSLRPRSTPSSLTVVRNGLPIQIQFLNRRFIPSTAGQVSFVQRNQSGRAIASITFAATFLNDRDRALWRIADFNVVFSSRRAHEGDTRTTHRDRASALRRIDAMSVLLGALSGSGSRSGWAIRSPIPQLS